MTRAARMALRTLVGSAAVFAVGCTTPDKKDPLTRLDPALTSKLQTGPAAAAAKPSAPLAFDPAQTGGNGAGVPNSVGRPKPGGGAGGGYAVSLPSPQLGVQPAASLPTKPGVSYAAGPAEPTRTSMPDRATPPASATPIPPAGSTVGLPAPKFDPPATEPPMTRANYNFDAPPAKPLVPTLSTPIRDPEPPAARPEPPPPPVDPLPIPAPVSPVAPVAVPPVAPPKASAAGSMVPLPSATEAPTPGVQPPPVKLPPADPVKPF